MTPTDATAGSGPLGSSHAELLAQIALRFTPRSSNLSSMSPRVTGRRPGRGSSALRSAAEPARPVLVAVAHGSRDPAARETSLALLGQVRALRPGLDVHLAHLGLDEPLLDDVLDTLDGSHTPWAPGAVLVPLLLGRGYHVRSDIPAAVARHPRLRAAVAAPLGPHPLLAEALRLRLAEVGWDTPDTAAVRRREARDAVVLAAAGSLDPASAKDAQKQALLLAALLHVPVVPAYVSAAAPTVPQAMAALRDRGYRRIAVASYFTAPGDFARRAAAAAPWLASPPLGAQEAMARLVLDRYDSALAGVTGGANGLAADPAVVRIAG